MISMTEEYGHTLTGDIQQHAQFASRILKNQRDIWVYLPPCYRRSTSCRYPVFYLHDGQNVFDAATAFGGTEWNADETAQELINRRLIEPLIIVAVGSVGEDRIHEYTPTNGRLEPNGASDAKSRGLLRDYGRFLVHELKPFIDQTYRTRPDKDSTGLGGSSLGGLASLILSLWFPNTFTRIAALSPSIWWDDFVIYRIVEEIDEAPRSSKIWLDTGTHEEGWERAGHLRDQLIERGWRLHEDLHYKEVQGAEHAEWAWSARFEAVLRFLFPYVPPQHRTRRRRLVISTRPAPDQVNAPIVRLRRIRHNEAATIST
jgi:predicted alpha/beta superfamily hydrolase